VCNVVSLFRFVLFLPLGDRQSTAPWLRGKITHNVLFDFEQLVNFSKVITASLDIQFAGMYDQAGWYDQIYI
jgi:hypothetical protein